MQQDSLHLEPTTREAVEGTLLAAAVFAISAIGLTALIWIASEILHGIFGANPVHFWTLLAAIALIEAFVLTTIGFTKIK